MSSSISGGAPTSTPSTTNVATPIAFDNFDLFKRRCWAFIPFRQKEVSETVGGECSEPSTWAEIGPITLRRLKKMAELSNAPRCGLGTYENLVFLFVLKSTI